MKKDWRQDYGLFWLLLFLFLASWAAQFFTQLADFKNEANTHHEVFQWGAFMWDFWRATLENWQSEFLQLLTFVVATAYLYFKGSPESKDSDEQMQATLDRIERRLARMEGGTGADQA